MLRHCAKEYGWTHNEMMSMPWRVLKRYYGYWIIDRIQESEAQEKQRMEEQRQESRQNANWKSL